MAGPSAAFLFGAAAAAMAFLIAMTIMPDTPPRRAATGGALLDFRPVFRNRRAMAWIVGYTVHTWELAALRAWGVTFLTVSIARLGAPGWLPPPMCFSPSRASLASPSRSPATRPHSDYGRSRVVLGAMLTAAALSLLAGWTTGVSVIARRRGRVPLEYGDLLSTAPLSPQARCRRQIRNCAAPPWGCIRCQDTRAALSAHSVSGWCLICSAATPWRMGPGFRPPRSCHHHGSLGSAKARPRWMVSDGR